VQTTPLLSSEASTIGTHDNPHEKKAARRTVVLRTEFLPLN